MQSAKSEVRSGSDLSPMILDSVIDSVDKTYSAYFSEKPLLTANEHGGHDGPCIAGIISFLGDLTWSLSWILPKDLAPILAQRFAGFEIPFDSPDMGDMAGELVNVLAGEIVSQLDKRHIKAQMSLPTIARGGPLVLVPENGPTIANLEYTSKEGAFWFRLAGSRNRPLRMPGK